MKALLFSLAILLLSCAGSKPEGQRPTQQILIQNDNWLDVVIFVVTMSGVSQRLGDVRSINQEVFDMPGEFSEGSIIRLLVEPIGSNEYFLTEQIALSSSQVIFLRVSQHLSASSWTITDVGE